MNDSQLMCGTKGFCHLAGDLHGFRNRKSAFSLHNSRQSLAFDILHCDVQQSIARLAEIVYRGDVWMRYVAGVRSFSYEPGDGARIASEATVQDLDGTTATDLHVLSKINFSEAPFSETLKYPIGASEHLSDQYVFP